MPKGAGEFSSKNEKDPEQIPEEIDEIKVAEAIEAARALEASNRMIYGNSGREQNLGHPPTSARLIAAVVFNKRRGPPGGTRPSP